MKEEAHSWERNRGSEAVCVRDPLLKAMGQYLAVPPNRCARDWGGGGLLLKPVCEMVV